MTQILETLFRLFLGISAKNRIADTLSCLSYPHCRDKTT